MELTLRIVNGKHTGQTIKVLGDQYLIGRGEGCDLRPTSEMVSRRHCQLTIENDRLFLQDFGSSNGTFVNSDRMEGRRELKPHDQIKVGPLQFEVLFSVGSPPENLQKDEFIMEWLTDVPATEREKDTVEYKLDETHSEPRVPVAKPEGAKERKKIQPKVGEAKTMRMAKPPQDPPPAPADSKDASGAAGAAIGTFLSALEKNKNKRKPQS